MKLLFAYLLLINAAGFLVMHIDKQKARKNRWRISERAMFTIATIGGSLGVLAGMRICRHKTRHEKFTIGIPIILAFQIVFLFCIIVMI